MRAARIDGNHTEIVDALRRSGRLVLSLARMGEGVPDALTYRADEGFRLIEIKMPKGKIRRQQEAFAAKGWPVDIVRSVEEIA